MVDDKKLRMTVYANVNDINDSRQPGQETEWTPAEAAKNQRTTQAGGLDYRRREKKFLNDKLMVVLEGFDILKQLKHVEYIQTSSYVSSKRTNVIPS